MLCLVVVEVCHLPHAGLAVWTSHMVMAQYPFTVFQKGLERIAGRGLGILAGVALVLLLPEAWLVQLMIELVLLTGFFYFYFADRLAYTFLNAGLYLIAIVAIGHTNPAAARVQGWEMFTAVVVGVVVANLVMWLTGAEASLHIEPGRAPLLPVRGDWLNHSVMLVTTAMLVLVLTHWLGLPVEKAIFSVFMLAVTPDLQSSLRKGQLRLLGAVLAVAWAVVVFVLVGRAPHLIVLAVLLFAGMFGAAYLTRVGGSNSYVGLQIGLVLPMLVVVPASEFGDLTAAWQRIEGVLAALVATLLVGGVWPNYAPKAVPPAAQGP